MPLMSNKWRREGRCDNVDLQCGVFLLIDQKKNVYLFRLYLMDRIHADQKTCTMDMHNEHYGCLDQGAVPLCVSIDL